MPSKLDRVLLKPLDYPLAERTDGPTAGVTYRGVAYPGTPGSAPEWRISRTTVVGAVTTVEWANGVAAFNSVWDNRVSLSYS